MSQWSWKQAVAEQSVNIVNSNKNAEFDLEQIYALESVFRERFPKNRHVREKIRQTLQRLRDIGFLEFLRGGRYRLNLAFTDLELETARAGEPGISVPETRTVVRSIRIRNTLLATDMKHRYENVCQVCQETVQLTDATYAESHHVKPLGSPHFGPDTEGNILVVCPNHHVMFDRGALAVDPTDLLVSHISGAFEPRFLFILPWHNLNRRALEYHQSRIYGKKHLSRKR
ncbi:MAG: HNH endonuclease [Pirellulaceae bacterium]|nr:HNH endonuclease [Pirellulaceae bacterium]